jgi:anaerobic ribonucleoside-triphosphate reductase activating protein
MQKQTTHPLGPARNVPPGYLNIMGYVSESEVNGPGKRAVIWLQGCLRECPGCFNPDSWSFEINKPVSIISLARCILDNSSNTGVTFSGGEPFWQAIALAQLASILKSAGLNVMSFTGFTLAQLQSKNAPPGAQELLSKLDILVDGPFIQELAISSPYSPVSSMNQKVHVFSPALKNQINWSSDQMEIHILEDGSRIITGYRDRSCLEDLNPGERR